MIQLIFFIVGVIAIFTGELSQGFLRVVYGKGIYVFSPKKIRTFGCLLTSPLLFYCVLPYILRTTGDQNEGFDVNFYNAVFMIGVFATSVIYISFFRHSDPNNHTLVSPRATNILGIIFFIIVTLIAILSLISEIVSARITGIPIGGSTWLDTYPFNLQIGIILVSGLGIGFLSISVRWNLTVFEMIAGILRLPLNYFSKYKRRQNTKLQAETNEPLTTILKDNQEFQSRSWKQVGQYSVEQNAQDLLSNRYIEIEKMRQTVKLLEEAGYRFSVKDNLPVLKRMVQKRHRRTLAHCLAMAGYRFNYDEIWAMGNPKDAEGLTINNWMAKTSNRRTEVETPVTTGSVNSQ